MRNKFFFILLIALSFGSLNASAQEKPKPKVINGGVINGKATSLPKPEYPAAASAVKASSVVNVQVTIDESGSIISASAISGHPSLRQAAERAAQMATFQPTMLSGQPVKVTGVIVYNFVARADSPTNEEKLGIMGLATFLTISAIIPNDEWDVLKKEDLADVPNIAKELEPLTSITKQTSNEKRAEIASGVLKSLENKLNGADAWQLRFGKEFGGLMLEIGKVLKIAEHQIDEASVRNRLIMMRDLMSTAPDNFPPDVADKLNQIAKFADVPELNSEENKSRFIALLGETLTTISPDFTEN